MLRVGWGIVFLAAAISSSLTAQGAEPEELLRDATTAAPRAS